MEEVDHARNDRRAATRSCGPLAMEVSELDYSIRRGSRRVDPQFPGRRCGECGAGSWPGERPCRRLREASVIRKTGSAAQCAGPWRSRRATRPTPRRLPARSGAQRGKVASPLSCTTTRHALAKKLVFSQGENLGFENSRASLQLDGRQRLERWRTTSVSGGSRCRCCLRPALSARRQDPGPSTLAGIARGSRGDWAGYLTRLDAAQKMPPVQPVSIAGMAERATALARLGRVAEAQALIAPTPLDCQPCIVGRGTVAEPAGRRAEADHWFAEASRMAPSLPNGPLYWGRALLERGDAAPSRQSQFREAAGAAQPPGGGGAGRPGRGAGPAGRRRGRGRSSTPLRRQAHPTLASRMHLKWGEALAKQGKAAEARAQFALAAGLDLTAAERAELAGVFHG